MNTGSLQVRHRLSLMQPSSMEDLNTKIDRLSSKESITTAFKLHCLNSMLKFLKDETQLNLVYSNLTIPQAELITTLICNSNVNTDIGYGYKSFYAPLWETIEFIGLKYELRITDLGGVSGNKCLVLDKVPKNKNEKVKEKIDIKPTPMDTSEFEPCLKSETGMSFYTNSNEKRKSKDILKSLSTLFVKSSLDKMMAFLNDDTQASVTFSRLSEDEFFFFANFNNLMCSSKMRFAFTNDIRKLIRKIKIISDTEVNYKLIFKKERMCNSSNRAMTVNKVPVFEKRITGSQRIWADMMKNGTPSNSSTNRCVSRERGNIKISVRSQSNDVKTKTKKVKKYSILTQSFEENPNYRPAHVSRDRVRCTAKLPLESSASTNNSAKSMRSASCVVETNHSGDRCVSKDRKASSINFYKGGVLDIQNSELSVDNDTKTIEEFERDRRKDITLNGVVLNHRKTKLLEAMSVPMKCDKAMKMMFDMGWDGGALGARGEGITEPIIPALEIVTGAGLGHIKSQKYNIEVASPTLFRFEILRHILDLVRSNNQVKIVTYRSKLKKDDVAFLQCAVDSFSVGTRMELEKDEMVVADRITELLRETGMMIKVHIKAKKVLEITKCQLPLINPRKVEQDKMVNIIKFLSTGDIQSAIFVVAPSCLTSKKYNVIYTQTETLLNILNLLKSDDLSCTIKWNFTLSIKAKRGIDKAIKFINNGDKLNSNILERMLSDEIIKFIGDYQLNHEYHKTFTTLTVTKIFKNKNYVSSKSIFSVDQAITMKVDDYKTTNININNENDKISNNNFDKCETALNDEKVAISNQTKTTESVKTQVNVYNKETISDHSVNDTMNREQNYVSDSNKIQPISGTDIIDDNKSVEVIIDSMDSSLISDESNLLKSSNDGDDCSYSEINIKTDNIGISIENCDNLEFENDVKQLKQAIIKSDDIENEDWNICTKRSRTESVNSDVNVIKKLKMDTKKVHIVHCNYPTDVLNKENIKNIQVLISENIQQTKELPLLKCHGVQDGALVYSCHSENSYYWLIKTIKVASDVKVLDTKEVVDDAFKMALKFNCYFDIDVDYMFNMLELYNKGLCTSKWLVLKHNIFLDHISFVVKMDGHSYDYIRNSGYALYAGVDEVQFSIVCN